MRCSVCGAEAPAATRFCRSCGAPLQKQASNTPFVLSIIALVTSILGLFPVSLVLSIIALVKNHSQKQRGEYSTKQTPTFVMALIGLILSILVAIATVVVGGAIWLAVLNGDIDLEHITESTAPTQVTQEEELDPEIDDIPIPEADEDASTTENSSDSDSSEEASTTSAQTDNSNDLDDPTLADFTWYGGQTSIPEGADILTSIYDVEGSWKAYIYDDVMDRLCFLRIEAGQGEATATIDWLYVHDNSTDTGSEDTTPDFIFTGEWDGMLGLEALGPGRLALMDFWQDGNRQYGMGSYMWPSGETAMVLLVRP